MCARHHSHSPSWKETSTHVTHTRKYPHGGGRKGSSAPSAPSKSVHSFLHPTPACAAKHSSSRISRIFCVHSEARTNMPCPCPAPPERWACREAVGFPQQSLTKLQAPEPCSWTGWPPRDGIVLDGCCCCVSALAFGGAASSVPHAKSSLEGAGVGNAGTTDAYGAFQGSSLKGEAAQRQGSSEGTVLETTAKEDDTDFMMGKYGGAHSPADGIRTHTEHVCLQPNTAK